MVTIWFAFTCVKRSIFWVVGHFTSIKSITAAFPIWTAVAAKWARVLGC